MFRRSIFLAFLLGVGVISLAGGQEKPRFAGPTADGFLLPNGWTISPAGEQVALTDLPLNIIPLADNKHALVACSGYNPHALSLVDLQTKQVVSKYSPGNSWFGLAVSPEENKSVVVGRQRQSFAHARAERQHAPPDRPARRQRGETGKAATGKKKKDLAARRISAAACVSTSPERLCTRWTSMAG